MRMRTAGALGALLLVVAGCGGGSDDDVKKAIADELVASSGDGLEVSKSEAECIADGMVDEVGVDQLKEYGIVTDDGKVDKSPDDVKMSEDDADATATAFVDCVDVQELMLGQIPTEGMDDSMKACVEEALSEDVIHDVLAASFAGEDLDSAFPDLATTMQECMAG